MRGMAVPSDFWWGTGGVLDASRGRGARIRLVRVGNALGRVPPSGEGNGFGTRYAEDFELYAEYGLTPPPPGRSTGRASSPRRAAATTLAIEHYREILSAARAAGVNPWVCLHHFTLPGWFTEVGEGGFLDERGPLVLLASPRRVLRRDVRRPRLRLEADQRTRRVLVDVPHRRAFAAQLDWGTRVRHRSAACCSRSATHGASCAGGGAAGRDDPQPGARSSSSARRCRRDKSRPHSKR